MSMQKDNNFWHKYFQSFKAYLESDKYNLFMPSSEVIEIVEHKEKLSVDPYNESYINVNVPGNYFVKDDFTIYTEAGVIVEVLITGDTFTIEDVTYFLDSSKKVHELGKQWNNSLLGDNGISLVIGGGFDIKEDTDLSLWTAPQISFVFDVVAGVNALERESTTALKLFNFDIDIFVKETDSYESLDSTGYNELNRVDSLLNTFIYDYFQTKKCAHDLGSVTYKGHEYDLEKYIEDRPSLVAIKTNRLTFR